MTFVERIRTSLHRLVTPLRMLQREERQALAAEAEAQVVHLEGRMKALGLQTAEQHAETLARINRMRRNVRRVDH